MSLTQAVAALLSHQHAGGEYNRCPKLEEGSGKVAHTNCLLGIWEDRIAKVCTAWCFCSNSYTFWSLATYPLQYFFFFHELKSGMISSIIWWKQTAFALESLDSNTSVCVRGKGKERAGERTGRGRRKGWRLMKKPFADDAFCDNQIL